MKPLMKDPSHTRGVRIYKALHLGPTKKHWDEQNILEFWNKLLKEGKATAVEERDLQKGLQLGFGEVTKGSSDF